MKSISGLWHPSPTLRNALHSSSLSGAYNSGHTATLRSAQIAKATSYVRKTLYAIVKINVAKSNKGRRK